MTHIDRISIMSDLAPRLLKSIQEKPVKAMRKDTFTVAGITFDTRLSRDGLYRFLKHRHSKEGKIRVCTEEMGRIIDPENWGPLDEKYYQLHVNFDKIRSESGLEHPPNLAFCSYGVPFAAVLNANAKRPTIVVDHMMVRLLEPKEMEAILAHEFAHLILKHPGGSRPNKELEADKLAGELVGDPEAVRRALAKIRAFQKELRKAVPVTDSLIFDSVNLLREVTPNLFGNNSPRHPPYYIRADRLRKQAAEMNDKDNGPSR